jgi:enoyl-CoA hydratase/carnithine racemase
VLPSEVLVERACTLASDFAAIPATSFAMTKQMLREPAMERVRTAAESSDRRVFELWNLPATRAAIRHYMEKTFARP